MGKYYRKTMGIYKNINDLSGAMALLAWDQETYMPTKGASRRGQQLGTVSSLIHDMLTSEEMRSVLEKTRSETLTTNQKINIREISRKSDRSIKIPVTLVRKLAETSSAAIGVWVEARKNNDFKAFAPWIDKLVNLQQETAEAVGYDDEPYDALIDEYEPGITTKQVIAIFDSIRDPLVDLVNNIQKSHFRPRTDFLEKNYPVKNQQQIASHLAKIMGFDFESGRIDISAHPFCTNMGINDVRLTNRYDKNLPTQSLYGIIHEVGHALYEQGLDPAHEGTPRGSSVSLGIHESQSRLWENMVGRSRAFWRYFFPVFSATFPENLIGITEEEIYAAVNEVKPSLIRVEADEITYNLHIILRFEIERGLFTKEYTAADLPAIWAEKMKSLMGLKPPDYRTGILQDIHWSHGSFGYFPTYTLGNIYAAQLYNTATQELPKLNDDIAHGNLLPLREWLKQKIHRPGMTHSPAQLIEHITGKPISTNYFLTYIRNKYNPLYSL
tara:strand:- start:100102 stop:101595 length:1494 start_codon:yes stop_codon:yes gene_type:complete